MNQAIREPRDVIVDGSAPLTVEAVLSITAAFALAMNQQTGLSQALAELKQAVGAHSAGLIRWLRSEAAGRTVAQTGKALQFPDVAGALRALLDRELPRAAPGEIHRLKALPDIGETLVIVLRNDRTEADVILLRAPAPDMLEQLPASLSALAGTLAGLWARRRAGMATGLAADAAQDSAPRLPAILGPDNPYGLSRSEFRVCGLLGRGLRPVDIAAELGLSVATVRSHLRSIYAKTELPGQRAVARQLAKEGGLWHRSAVVRLTTGDAA